MKLLLLLFGLGQPIEVMVISKNLCLRGAQQREHKDSAHLKGFVIPSFWC